MNIRVIDHLKHEEVSLKPRVDSSGEFVQVGTDKRLIASRKQKGFISTFKEISAVGEHSVDGKKQYVTLVALQVDKKYFLVPQKPKDISNVTKLKIRPKEIESSKIFDKKDSEIDHKSLKYWFRLKSVDNALVYESLAYKGFYLSVEGETVDLRKCPDNLPTDENYHIEVVPAFSKVGKVEVRSHNEVHAVCRMSSSSESNSEVVYSKEEEYEDTWVSEGFTQENGAGSIPVSQTEVTESFRRSIFCREDRINPVSEVSSGIVEPRALLVERKAFVPEINTSETADFESETSCDKQNKSLSGQPTGRMISEATKTDLKMSFDFLDSGNRNIAETEESTEGTVKSFKESGTKKMGVAEPSDITVDCKPEADDRDADMTVTEAENGRDKNGTGWKKESRRNRKKLSSKRNDSRGFTSFSSAFFSFLFSCASSRNTTGD